MSRLCSSCKKEIQEWNQRCGECGFFAELVPDEEVKARFLRGPSLGALLFTQGWAVGARLYFFFLLSLVPVFGIMALLLCVIFGRRWSWKQGGWNSWDEFVRRMRMMDILGGVWVSILVGVYISIHFR